MNKQRLIIKKRKVDHAKAVEETKQKNAQIEAENKALKEAHDKASQQAAQTNQAVEQVKAKIKAEFPDAKVTETTKELKVDPTKTSYDAYTKVVDQVKLKIKKATEPIKLKKRKKIKKSQRQRLITKRCKNAIVRTRQK
ncbi:hypothetical protein [Streptococcus anginosus]|nr:hypothetical protein [Streptococcus anginosus]